MIHFPVPEALTFDDVLLLPGRSDVVPATVSTQTRVTKAITLNKAADSSTWGVLDSKAGAPNQRIIELNVKYNF
jgi:hypothetical protein